MCVKGLKKGFSEGKAGGETRKSGKILVKRLSETVESRELRVVDCGNTTWDRFLSVLHRKYM